MTIRQNWLQLTAIQAGGAICLPLFVVGYALGKSEGISSALLSIAIGNSLLLILALISGRYSAEKRLSTIECAIECFGRHGKVFFSAAMAFSMTGWFAIQLNLMGESLNQLLPINSGMAGPIAIGILTTTLGVKGLRGVGMLANISLPILIATIAIAISHVGDNVGALAYISKPSAMMPAGISLILACSIAAVIDLPTFFRLAKSKKDAVISLSLLFCVIIPFVELVGVILSASQKEAGFLEVLIGENPSEKWKLWVLGFVLLAGWTTNSANLYSAAVSLEPTLSSAPFFLRVLLVGSAGTLLSVFPLMEGLEIILQPIGVLLTSMGAVLMFHFFTQRKTTPVHHFIAWLMGVGAGTAALFYASMTGIAIVDAFFTSVFTMGAMRGLSIFKKEKVIHENS